MPRRTWDVAEAIRLRNEEYWTWQELGDRYGLTHQAVQQAIGRSVTVTVTVTVEELRAARRTLTDRIHKENAEEIMRRLDEGQGVRRIARELHLEFMPLDRWVKTQERTRERSPLADPKGRVARGILVADHLFRYPDERLLEALREAAEDLGRTPSVGLYREWHVRHPERGGVPSTALIVHRLGWDNALTMAGLPLNRRNRRNYTRLTADDCMEWVRRSRVDLGAFPSSGAYEEWAVEDPARPCLSLICLRVGGWRVVLARLMAEAEEAA